MYVGCNVRGTRRKTEREMVVQGPSQEGSEKKRAGYTHTSCSRDLFGSIQVPPIPEERCPILRVDARDVDRKSICTYDTTEY